MGRPAVFCGKPCRNDHAEEQRRAWHTGHVAGIDRGKLVCRECGGIFAAPPAASGRVPGFCSPQCRSADRRRKLDAYSVRQRRGPKGPVMP
jgi:hypothetical protein